MALSWSQALDDAASSATTSTFKRALAIAAIARTFNGIISVAQGTEIAVQPIGVGVTITLGEVLDPLNDLVERFSMLALVASVSLGLQITLADILSTAWFSGLMSAAIVAYLILMWRNPQTPGARLALRISGTVIVTRFLLAVAMLTTHWMNVTFLQERQEHAVAEITATTQALEQIQQESTAVEPGTGEEDFFDQLTQVLNSSRQALDINSQLDELKQRVEASVEELIHLIVIFLLQTLVLPFAAIWASWWALKQFWHWTAYSSRAQASTVD
jgi:hypothetical protein